MSEVGSEEWQREQAQLEADRASGKLRYVGELQRRRLSWRDLWHIWRKLRASDGYVRMRLTIRLAHDGYVIHDDSHQIEVLRRTDFDLHGAVAPGNSVEIPLKLELDLRTG